MRINEYQISDVTWRGLFVSYLKHRQITIRRLCGHLNKFCLKSGITLVRPNVWTNFYSSTAVVNYTLLFINKFLLINN